jgi:hypothetical protein
MTNEGFEEDYLFFDGPDCCEKWYPSKADCPSTTEAVDPEAEDEPWHSSPFSMDNYYYPDFEMNNCGYGWDYPAWMGKRFFFLYTSMYEFLLSYHAHRTCHFS